MIIGGNALRICKNIGTKSAPEFGKRELLLDVNGEQLKSSHPGVNTVPYVVDWDQDGVLDILLTDSFNHKGSVAVKFYRGLNTEEGIRFNPGVPLFTAKNDEKEFPGSWLNVCVTDWNNDGINDLIIGASIATLNGVFDYDLSWQWEHDTGISKKNNAYISPQTKRIIDQQLKSIAEYQKKTGLTDEELEAKNMPTVKGEFKHYYGKEAYKTLAHQGYTYVMLGEK
ncbi:MAG: FG-GAP repeat domain-containing protein [Cellulophaga sp.]